MGRAGHYITALGYGGDDTAYQRWWAGADERTHVIGNGILRFHSVYWLALLLSAGLPLPTTIFVHDYLNLASAKMSKTAGNTIAPADLVTRYGADAVRWWLLRDVARVNDTEFTTDRLIDTANRDLAHGLGNLISRTGRLAHQPGADPRPPLPGCTALPTRIDAALDEFCRARATRPTPSRWSADPPANGVPRGSGAVVSFSLAASLVTGVALPIDGGYTAQ